MLPLQLQPLHLHLHLQPSAAPPTANIMFKTQGSGVWRRLWVHSECSYSSGSRAAGSSLFSLHHHTTVAHRRRRHRCGVATTPRGLSRRPAATVAAVGSRTKGDQWLVSPGGPRRCRVYGSMARCHRAAQGVPVGPAGSGRGTYEYAEHRAAEFRTHKHHCALRGQEWSPFPEQPFVPTHTLPSLREKYQHLKPGERCEDAEVLVCGRVVAKREASKKLVFLDVVAFDHQQVADGHHLLASAAPASAAATTSVDSADAHSSSSSTDAAEVHLPGAQTRLQVMCTARHYEEIKEKQSSQTVANVSAPEEEFNKSSFQAFTQLVKRGDVVGIRGFPCKTKVGELSVVPREMTLLAACMRDTPEQLSEPNVRFRKRYLDFRINNHHIDYFILRSKVIQFVRSFLNRRGFVEVETPMLWPRHGGANARPFITKSNAFGESMELHMRVAPELFLKELVLGGMERVYELGRVFRNEGVDALHNPEFTTCEFYQAYSNYQELMTLTEELLSDLLRSPAIQPHLAPDVLEYAKASMQTTQAHKGGHTHAHAPFPRVEVLPALESALGTSLPDLNDPASMPALIALCEKANIHVAPPVTLPRIVDKLIGAFVEPQCTVPTFVVHHPLCLSPLAKELGSGGVAQRFELFVGGAELCNAYSELNDPDEQSRRFAAQQVLMHGDPELPPNDEDFVEALRHGLPPTAGWGMGIDRLCMWLAGVSNVREMLLFPMMKPTQE